MSSLARAHRERCAAEALAKSQGAVVESASAPEIDEANPLAGDYRVLLASLHVDLRKLADINSHEARIPEKAAMMGTYLAWVQGAIEAGKLGAATHDEIVAEQLVWALDTGAYDYALTIADHMIRCGVRLPERFSEKSTVAAFVVKKVSATALQAISTVPLQVLQAVSSLTSAHDMHDDARASLMKALSRGYAAEAEAFDPTADNAVAGGKPALLQAAIVHARRALELDSKAGVKKDIEKLERALKEAGGAPQPATDTDGDDIENPLDQGDDEEE